MLFSSNIFLFLFLPVILAGYYALYKRNWRNMFLFFASLFFYAWGEKWFVFVMIAVIVFNYRMALAIDENRSDKSLSKFLLFLTIFINLSILFYYKYFNFSIKMLNLFGFNFSMKNIALPIGISFFIFQAMSYVIDVYRKTIPVQTKFSSVGLYVSLFPQLIAGPIVRYGDIAEAIENRRERFADFSAGVRRFIAGFGKKVILANNMAILADRAFSVNDANLSTSFAWLGAIAYSFQIFFDFSGYSDMAIGLGRMFGFKFLENFNYPYISGSVSEFWRRWHISLGSWFRDYVYIPLGGSRGKQTEKPAVIHSKPIGGGGRTVFNLFVVWVLTGAWHGASLNFIFWGLFYFVLLVFEKLTGLPDKFNSRASRILYRVFTMFAVCGGWVLFRAQGLRAAIKYGSTMIAVKDNPLFCVDTIGAFREFWFYLLFALLCSTPVFKILKDYLIAKGGIVKAAVNIAALSFYVFILMWSVSFIIMDSYNPFIYFNF